MNKDEKSLQELYEATLSPLNGVGLGPQAEDSAGGLGSPTMTKIDVQDVETPEDEEREQIDDHEVDMAKSELYKLAEYAPKLLDLIKNYDELEGWVQAKLTKASDYVSTSVEGVVAGTGIVLCLHLFKEPQSAEGKRGLLDRDRIALVAEVKTRIALKDRHVETTKL